MRNDSSYSIKTVGDGKHLFSLPSTGVNESESPPINYLEQSIGNGAVNNVEPLKENVPLKVNAVIPRGSAINMEPANHQPAPREKVSISTKVVDGERQPPPEDSIGPNVVFSAYDRDIERSI